MFYQKSKGDLYFKNKKNPLGKKNYAQPSISVKKIRIKKIREQNEYIFFSIR